MQRFLAWLATLAVIGFAGFIGVTYWHLPVATGGAAASEERTEGGPPDDELEGAEGAPSGATAGAAAIPLAKPETRERPDITSLLPEISLTTDHCRKLAELPGIKAVPVPDLEEQEVCGYTEAVRLETSAIPYSGVERIVTCRLARRLIDWEKQVVQPAAVTHFGQQVARITHYGTYSCRYVGGGQTGRVSQHAKAKAIDIAAFTLEDGSVVSVLKDWNGPREAQAFLREVRDGACDLFQAVLSPEYNEAHANHFHFDMGPYRTCD